MKAGCAKLTSFIRRRQLFYGLTVLLAVASCLSFNSVHSATIPMPPVLSSKSAVLIDGDGRIVYSENADLRLPMASTTKIMTALVALDFFDPQKIVSITPDAVGTEGSSAYLTAYEKIPLIDLLYALMLQSANDAAIAIAVAVGGDLSTFVDMMNKKASDLGLENSHFMNPHGLYEDGHYTSAYDLAVIMNAAMHNEIFAKIVSTKKYVSEPECGLKRYFTNHNRLLWRLDSCIGGKTGFTKKTGRCLVSVTDNDGLVLVAVTLSDPNDWTDHEKLHAFGKSRYVKRVLAKKGQYAVDVAVENSDQKNVTLVNRDCCEIWLPAGTSFRYVYECDRFIYAPASSDKSEGKVVFLAEDNAYLADIPLYPETNVEIEVKKKKNLFKIISDFFEKILSLFRGAI